MGIRGVNPWKILKFETQFGASGAFWQEIDGSPVFHLCERNHAMMLDIGIDTT